MRWHTHVCTIVFAVPAFVTANPAYGEGRANEWAIVEALKHSRLQATKVQVGDRLCNPLLNPRRPRDDQ